MQMKSKCHPGWVSTFLNFSRNHLPGIILLSLQYHWACLADDVTVKLLGRDGESAIINRLGEDGRLKKVKVRPNQASGILPVLAQLLEQDPYTEYTYLCHPAVRHVSKLRMEGKWHIH